MHTAQHFHKLTRTGGLAFSLPHRMSTRSVINLVLILPTCEFVHTQCTPHTVHIHTTHTHIYTHIHTARCLHTAHTWPCMIYFWQVVVSCWSMCNICCEKHLASCCVTCTSSGIKRFVEFFRETSTLQKYLSFAYLLWSLSTMASEEGPIHQGSLRILWR